MERGGPTAMHSVSEVVPKKGIHPYTVHFVGEAIQKVLGYSRVILKSDQEEALKSLRKQLRISVGLDLAEELSAVGDSKSNGKVERANQTIQGQIRTMKLQLENRIQAEIPADAPIWPWLIKHSAATWSRFHVDKEGVTPYRRIRGRNFTRPLAEFGEAVWYHMKQEGDAKLMPRWGDGIFLGMAQESDEILLGTPEGIVRAKAFRRKGSAEDRWNKDAVLAVKGVPWEPVPGQGGYKLPSKVIVSGESGVEIEPLQVDRQVPRRYKLRIRKEDLLVYGWTPGCRGCAQSAMGKSAGHSDYCRQRIYQEMRNRNDPRILDYEVEGALDPEVPELDVPDDVEVPDPAEGVEDLLEPPQYGCRQSGGYVLVFEF